MQLTNSRQLESTSVQSDKRLTFLKFFLRYPIFLLAVGPPVFKMTLTGGDTTQSHTDIWNIIQVGWLFMITLRAIIRLAYAQTTQIPKQTRSILKYPFFLGLLFLGSVSYSPGRLVSLEFCVLYFATMICVLEFVVDAYQNPPDWMQCLLQIRLMSLLLYILVLTTALLRPNMVLAVVPGAGIRLLGGTVASVPVICPLIAIISAYCFLRKLEPRTRSFLYFLVGTGGLAIAQIRGAEVGLLVILIILGLQWAKTSRRSAYLAIAGVTTSMLLGSIFLTVVGGDRIWNTFNRNLDTENLMSFSGRMGTWVSLVEYSMSHPQGLGYIAGIRTFHGGQYTTSMRVAFHKVGGVDSSYMEVLGDAGWLALALYLIILIKVIVAGWRTVANYASDASRSDTMATHAARCAILLLLFFMVEAVESSVFEIPLSQGFYIQDIIIAVILGATASLRLASRQRKTISVR
jgi:hypothetical protein